MCGHYRVEGHRTCVCCKCAGDGLTARLCVERHSSIYVFGSLRSARVRVGRSPVASRAERSPAGELPGASGSFLVRREHLDRMLPRGGDAVRRLCRNPVPVLHTECIIVLILSHISK